MVLVRIPFSFYGPSTCFIANIAVKKQYFHVDGSYLVGWHLLSIIHVYVNRYRYSATIARFAGYR
jgi:hypothetical protein